MFVPVIIIIIIIIIQSVLQPLVGFGLLYDFVPQSSIFTLLSPVSHFIIIIIIIIIIATRIYRPCSTHRRSKFVIFFKKHLGLL